jgi:hypothetical protein
MTGELQSIKLNDIEYVKKEDYDALVKKTQEDAKLKKAERFSAHSEGSIIRSLSDIFHDEEGITEEDAVLNGASVIDAANVCMVCGKTERAKRVLARFISPDSERKEFPKWDFVQKDGKPSASRYSMEYLSKIFKFFAERGDSVNISVNHNHPAKIEDDDFAFILAPRIETDEESA